MDDLDEGTEVIVSPSVLEGLERASIDTQISTAKKYPRSIRTFKTKALEMATLDEDTAASMFYALPRSGKQIEGPSVRLAEVVGSAWGNIRYGSRIIEVGDKYVTAQGVCFDLETNTQAAVEVRRRITDRNGRRFNDDMITVTGNAAMSIALRNAVFKVVPFAYVKAIYEQAKLVAVGENQPMSTRRERALGFFRKLGARDEQIFKMLGRAGVEDVTMDDLVTLTGLRTAIRDGEITLENVLSEGERAPVVATPNTLTPESIKAGAATGENDAKRPSETPKPADPAPERLSEQVARETNGGRKKPAPAAPAEPPPESQPAVGVTESEIEEASKLFS